jgi:hypothetical protein
VTAHNMRYFEEGHYDERADRRIQLMKFVSFYDELPPHNRNPPFFINIACYPRPGVICIYLLHSKQFKTADNPSYRKQYSTGGAPPSARRTRRLSRLAVGVRAPE